MIGYFALAGAYFLSWYFFWRLKLKSSPGRLLAFHDISKNLDLSITRIRPEKFEHLIKYLASLGYHGVSIAGLKRKNDIALTFDDGWQSFFINALPILNKYNFKATVFIISGYVGNKSRWDYKNKGHLSWHEIKILVDEGIEIGSHSVNHVDLRYLDDNKLEYEIAGSKKQIEDKLGLPVKHFSYPFGRYNRRVIEAVKRAGYENAFALGAGSDDFAVSRHCMYLYDTPYSINMKLFRGSWLEQCKDYINNSLAGGTITLRKLFPVKQKG